MGAVLTFAVVLYILLVTSVWRYTVVLFHCKFNHSVHHKSIFMLSNSPAVCVELWPWYSTPHTNMHTWLCTTKSQCNRTVALDAFFKQIVQYPIKIGWIGSGCSVATEPTAEVSYHYNITQVQSCDGKGLCSWGHPWYSYFILSSMSRWRWHFHACSSMVSQKTLA